MDKPLRVGAKFLASMVLPHFCERCYWYRLKCGSPPYSSFPGIFNEIDRYTKNLVHAHIDQHGHPPTWLGDFSKAVAYKNLGFMKWLDEDNAILLTGAPDAVFHGKDQLHWYLGDYKTARYSEGQDKYLAQYKVQLLGYAFLMGKTGYKMPDHAALFYFGPPSEPTVKELLARTEKDGFALPLSVEVVTIELGDVGLIPDLLCQTRKIFDKTNAPAGHQGCSDCMRLDRYLRQSENDTRPENELVAVDIVVDGKGKRQPLARYIEKGGDSAILAQDNGEWFPEWAGQ